ncbi:MAG: hypothetical protein R3A78_01095 [Polyangiales bacterium]
MPSAGSPTAPAHVAILAKLDGVVRGFVLTETMPGGEMQDKWSLRASVTSELVLEDVLPNVSGMKGAGSRV